MLVSRDQISNCGMNKTRRRSNPFAVLPKRKLKLVGKPDQVLAMMKERLPWFPVPSTRGWGRRS